eukprot:3374485-Lingulodinium_polyedra.AAC.1
MRAAKKRQAGVAARSKESRVLQNFWHRAHDQPGTGKKATFYAEAAPGIETEVVDSSSTEGKISLMTSSG